jgi:hypothetical protein
MSNFSVQKMGLSFHKHNNGVKSALRHIHNYNLNYPTQAQQVKTAEDVQLVNSVVG